MGLPLFIDILRAPDKRGIEDNSKIIFPYFSKKTYIVTPHWNHLAETVLMRGHNLGFYGEIRKITP